MRKYLAWFLLIGCARIASAQLPSASTRALGMGDNYTAVARGFAAVAWNPALLALPGNPASSFAVLPARGIAGFGPVTLADINSYGGQYVPSATRENWLQAIEQSGKEHGVGGGDVTELALQMGRVALQVSTSFRLTGDLTPGAAELLLFGNAGRNGAPQDLILNNSRLVGHAVSTVAVSYARPVVSTTVGITLKYMMGHGLLIGSDQGSSITDDPAVRLKFPVVSSLSDGANFNSGRGLALDVGFAKAYSDFTFAFALQNLMTSFAWDLSQLELRNGIARFDDTTRVSDFSARGYEAAPFGLKDLVAKAVFKPSFSAGVAYEASRSVTLSSDVRARFGESIIQDDPRLHLGVGAELRALDILPIRAGAAVVFGGYEVSGGLGLNLGPLSLGASVMKRHSDLGNSTITMVTLFSKSK
jgi:hypothetical protein